jgi:hypothetical protein
VDEGEHLAGHKDEVGAGCWDERETERKRCKERSLLCIAKLILIFDLTTKHKNCDQHPNKC